MRHSTAHVNSSLTNELGALANLYRTVFWMMGRKARYGRLWPPEAEMGGPHDVQVVTPPQSMIEASRSHMVEATSRD
jgi:hypothetical protein